MLNFLINISVFLFSLGFLILIHELGHFFFARKFGVGVKRFSIGFGKIIYNFGKDKYGTEYVLSMIPLGGYVELEGETCSSASGSESDFVAKPIWQRAVIISAGPLVNYLLGFIMMVFVYVMGAPELLPVVGNVLEGSVAEKIGLQKGDKIIEVDSKKIDLWDEMAEYIHGRPEQKVSLKIERSGKIITLTAVPEKQKIRNLLGQEEEVGILGITPDLSAYETVYFPLHKAMVKAFMRVKEITVMIFKSIILLFEGDKTVREAIAGPIGIYEVTSEARSQGLNVLLMVLAMLSISLAVFNILPIPVLDGGHLLFLLIEAVIRRPIPERVYSFVYQTGMTFIIILSVFVLCNDIRKLTKHNTAVLANQTVNNEEMLNYVQENLP